MESITTQNLILRKAKISDLEKIWNNVWKEEELAQTMLWKPTKTYEEAVERLNKTIEYQSENYAYFVCLKTTDEPIGFAGIKEVEEGIYQDCGICIAKNYQGKGYAKEIVHALKFLIFEQLKGDRFLYSCFVDNEKSKRVCLSQGFKYMKSGDIIREWDNKKFRVDYYHFDKDFYKNKS